MKIRVVLDTNVLLSGLQSKKGASYEVLRRLGQQFDIAISVPLVLEYEEILKEKLPVLFSINNSDIDDIINYYCKIGISAEIFYLWRPFLPDPEDDHILELALAAGCSYIITYNKRDFRGVEERFGIEIIDAADFLKILKKVPKRLPKNENYENDEKDENDEEAKQNDNTQY